MSWKTFYLTIGFAMAVGFAVIFATSGDEGAMLVKTDRLNVTPTSPGFNMERFAG